MDEKVYQYMITRAALLLRAYPTTLEQDQQTIKESQVHARHFLCGWQWVVYGLGGTLFLRYLLDGQP